MQDSGGKLLLATYAISVSSAAEADYNVTELGCLAVMWSVKLFRPYIYGWRFTIVTDHRALRWLMTSRQLAVRLHCWARALQGRDFDV